MARLGTIDLCEGDGTTSGVGLLLVRTPRQTHAFVHRGTRLEIIEGAPLIVCRFHGAESHSDALREGNALVQEALDILSMTDGPDLLTRDIGDEYFAWWTASGKHVFSAVSTTTMRFSVPPAKAVVKDSSGTIVEPPEVMPSHHIGFRYYRLAQTCDDLFDSFRNMYLAFELLLSSSYPKVKEQEIHWLRRALTSSDSDLRLAQLVPRGTGDPVAYIIQTVYENARLPLFHAKNERTYFTPFVSAADRAAVENALKLLTSIVVRMAEVWHNTRRLGGGVFFKWVYDRYKQVLTPSSVIVSASKFASDDDLGTVNAKALCKLPAEVVDSFNGEPRLHVRATLDLGNTPVTEPIRTIHVVNDEYPFCAHSLEAKLSLEGFDSFETITFLRASNVNQLRALFSR